MRKPPPGLPEGEEKETHPGPPCEGGGTEKNPSGGEEDKN